MQKDLPHMPGLQDFVWRNRMRITKLGEEVLRQKCEPVKPEEINDEINMEEEPGNVDE